MIEAKRAIINGDDFGYGPGVNEGIRRAYTEGVLTSTTVLTNVLTGKESLSGLKPELQKPALGIGVHLNLTMGMPLAADAWNIQAFTRPYRGTNLPEEWQGSAWREYFARFPKQSVMAEFRAQIQRARDIFGNIDHLDSHHGVASYPPALEVYEELALEFGLSLRHTGPLSERPVYGGEFQVDKSFPASARRKGIKTVDTVDMSYYSQFPNPTDAFCQALENIKPGEIVEFMFHPAVDDSQGNWRISDLKVLTDSKTIDAIKNLGIQLTTYRDSAY